MHSVAPEWRIGTYEWRPASNRLDWSPDLVRIYGLARAPTAEEGFYEHVHPEDRLRVEGETSSFLGSDSTSYSHTFRILRPDGAVRLILDRGAIERNDRGQATVLRGVNIDITDEAALKQAAEQRWRESERRYRALFEIIDDGFCVLEVRFDSPDRRIDYRVVEANPAFYDHTGFPKEILGRWLREAAPGLEEHWYETYGRVARTGDPVRFEQGSDMLGRWFDVSAFRIDPPQDRRVAVLFRDMSDRRRHEEQTQLLMREVAHRSKNMLSLIQAIARQTAVSGTADFVARFSDRLKALAAEQDLLVQNSWKTVPLPDLVRSQLAHFSDLVGARIEIAGPALSLTPDAAQALGMALHELATNAAKYGALSNGAGHVAISWSVDPEALPEARFALAWQERGGPPVVAPKRAGFGSTVTTRMVELSTRGQVSVDFAPAGLAWQLSCPAARVLDDPAAGPGGS